MVEEGADIGTLPCDTLKAEDGIEAFCKVVEGQRPQLVEVSDIVVGQHGVEGRDGGVCVVVARRYI